MNNNQPLLETLGFEYEARRIGNSLAIHANCLEWLARLPENCLHSIVTDPPYGVKEYDVDQLAKRANGNGGIWRIPPSFDGHVRSPLPRFTALDYDERRRLYNFFDPQRHGDNISLRVNPCLFFCNMPTPHKAAY